MRLPTIFVVSLTAVLVFFNASAAAQSQCVGLTKSQCDANPSCSWRKSSVNKNNVKTKAHCRALPNQAKAAGKKTTKKDKAATSSNKKSADSKSKAKKSDKEKKAKKSDKGKKAKKSDKGKKDKKKKTKKSDKDKKTKK